MADRRWRVSSHGIRLHAWEDGYTAFHVGSGDTHLLDPFTGEVLSCFMGRPLNRDELAQAMFGQATPELAAQEGEALERALAALLRVHLIEPLEP